MVKQQLRLSKSLPACYYYVVMHVTFFLNFER